MFLKIKGFRFTLRLDFVVHCSDYSDTRQWEQILKRKSFISPTSQWFARPTSKPSNPCHKYKVIKINKNKKSSQPISVGPASPVSGSLLRGEWHHFSPSNKATGIQLTRRPLKIIAHRNMQYSRANCRLAVLSQRTEKDPEAIDY